jgi:hypothetical protein
VEKFTVSVPDSATRSPNTRQQAANHVEAACVKSDENETISLARDMVIAEFLLDGRFARRSSLLLEARRDLPHEPEPLPSSRLRFSAAGIRSHHGRRLAMPRMSVLVLEPTMNSLVRDHRLPDWPVPAAVR